MPSFFDHVSDLHLDNAMLGGPFPWVTSVDLRQFKTDGASVLLVAGDTCNHPDDTIAVLNGIAPSYEYVVAVPGNHEGDRRSAIDLAANLRIIDAATPFQRDGIGFAGGVLSSPDEVNAVIVTVRAYESDPAITRVIVLSHYAPTPRIGPMLGVSIEHKANDLLDRLGTLTKRLDVVFGHLHLRLDASLDGARLHANPRGYRGVLRDGKPWAGRFLSFD